jgi:hydroxyethylthiazole kinase-like uncharacterized protein yjeF
MKILTANEMAEADRNSVAAGIPIQQLMQNAGKAVATFCLHHFAAEGRIAAPVGLIVVLAGKGNNGGDGLVAAADLAEAGVRVRVLLLGKADDLKDDAAHAFHAARLCKPTSGQKIDIQEVVDEAALKAGLDGATLILDAIVGTGFTPPLRGLAATARDLVAAMSPVPVIAVDLPSGWDADSVQQTVPDAFRASAVVTFTVPKLAHIFGHLTPPDVFGPVVVAAIGTPAAAIPSEANLTWAGSSKALAEKPRDIDGNKGRFGHVLLLGGAVGKAGAPSMASLACMRAGAGLVTAAVVQDILPTVAAIAPELMMTALEISHDQLVGDALTKLLKGITVVGIGPGLGTEPETVRFVREFVARVDLPLVIDADALNAIAGQTSILKEATAAKQRTIVLTPHPGEMGRLLGMTVKEIEADRLNLARNFATEHGVTLVLKGWRTLIAHPDGRVAVNTTGNPSMAKGGSGDILTGIVSALLAQYPESVPEAVEAAVFLHGLAGDFACLAQDEHTVLATDTVAHLWQAFRARVTDSDGYTWMTGAAAR